MKSKKKTNETKSILGWLQITLSMIFDVTMVTFWMPLLMSKFTNIVMDDG